MNRQAAFLVFAVAAGVFVGAVGISAWRQEVPWPGHATRAAPKSSSPEPGQGPSDELDSEQLADVVDSLTQVLNDEINERRILTEQLEQMRSEVLDLKKNLRARVEEAFLADDPSSRAKARGGLGRLGENPLTEAGFTRQQIDSIGRLEAEAQMARIDLDDRARREGWINTPRYVEETGRLVAGATAIRDAYGDEWYDRYLFARGYPNRIEVGSIIETSPARTAGFQRGDVIVRYAGEKVYSTDQLVDLRSSGVRGEPVTVEIMRDGQVLQLTMPRGPMGMTTGSTRADPAGTQD